MTAFCGIRLLVTGGRTYADHQTLFAALDNIRATIGIDFLIHGACHTPVNADQLAGQWARDHGIAELAYPVDHALDGPWPGAGPARNRRMFAASHPTHVLAAPGGTGTGNMISIANAHRVPVRRIKGGTL